MQQALHLLLVLNVIAIAILHSTESSEVVNAKPDQSGNANVSSKQDPRIVGGNIAPSTGLKYQLHFDRRGTFGCGASLIEIYDVQFAITATHCLWTGYPNRDSVSDPQELEVVAGDFRLSDRNVDREQRRKVSKVVPHPDYDPKFYGNDIAILFLTSGFDHTDYVEPLKLPGHDWDIPEHIHVSGWGSSFTGGLLTNDLKYVIIPTVDQFICEKFNQLPPVEISENQFCVGEIGGAVEGTCSGDSGGPATAYNTTYDVTYLAGVVSFGLTFFCGNPYYPTVFTRVSKYVDWIRIEVSKHKEAMGK